MDTTVVDFAPLADTLIQYVVVAVGAAFSVGLAWLGKKLKDKYDLDIEDMHRNALQDAFQYAINFAVVKTKEAYGDKLTMDMKNPLVSFAAAYMIQQVPETLTKFGINPNTDEGRLKIADMVDARLNVWMFDNGDAHIVTEETMPQEAPTSNVN